MTTKITYDVYKKVGLENIMIRISNGWPSMEEAVIDARSLVGANQDSPDDYTIIRKQLDQYELSELMPQPRKRKNELTAVEIICHPSIHANYKVVNVLTKSINVHKRPYNKTINEFKNELDQYGIKWESTVATARKLINP